MSLVRTSVCHALSYVLEPLLSLIRQRRDHGQRSIPEAMQVRIIRQLDVRPSIDYCRHLVQTYFPSPASEQRPEPERLVSAFASRLASLTDAIQDVRQASQLTDTLERQSLVGSIRRSISQLERLKRELGETAVVAGG